MAADRYPTQIREALEGHRREGVPFPMAWTLTLETVGRRAGWPLPFMRKHFERAYRREGEGVGQSVLVERIPRQSRKRLRSTPNRPVRCYAGTVVPCGNAPLPGKRFCRSHMDALQRARYAYEHEHARADEASFQAHLAA